MKEKFKTFFKISNEDIVMIVLALMSFSFGIWTTYRQLWLQDIGYNLSSISRILSVSLICSAIIIFVISFFSTKIKLKNVVMMSITLRAVALAMLLLLKVDYNIKFAMLLSIMCENIFSVAFYPLLATINKTNSAYQKHVLINYFAKDFAIIFGGIMLGVSIGKIIFNYETCLFITLMATISSAIVLLLFEEVNEVKKKNILSIKKAFRNLFKSKTTNMYLTGQFITEISYGIIFGMMMLLLTDYLKFNVSIASIFVIGCNLLGSITSSILTKYGEKLTTKVSILIKYGLRSIMYVVAFLSNNLIVYILTIILSYITTRILDDKVNGVYIRNIKTDSQFLFGNIRYFILCIGEGVGIYLAGILLSYSLKYLFIVAGILTVIGIIIYTKYCNTKDNS